MAESARYESSYSGRAELAAVAASTQDAIVGLTPQGIVASWNPAAVRLYGYQPEEIIGHPVRVLYPPGRGEQEAGLLRRTAAGERLSRQGVARRRRDGAVLDVSLTAVPVIGPEGAVVGIATISSADPRPRPAEGGAGREQRVGARLQQAQRLESLGQLAGGVAHDFNNLLAVILNYVSFVSEELAAATESDWAQRLETAHDDLAQVSLAGERAASLTRQLLTFARREVVRPQVLDLDFVVADVEELLRRTLGEEVELVISLAGHLWPVLADPGQLEQVLVNLAVNARDAMPSGGTLTIDTSNCTVDADSVAAGAESPVGPSVRLRVSDTGTGMPAEVVEHAFEPFFTTKSESAGTGLGLATVYGILAQNEGHIKIYSHPGMGTTFSITLPVTAEAPAPAPAPAGPGQRPAAGATVLVVEDEAALRAVTERIFARNGYRVITAADGPEALRAARDHPSEIDLLITDVVMPGMLGQDVAEQVRAIEPGVAVLFMSGYAQPVLTSQGRLDPNVALIEKPFSAPDLLVKAGQVLHG
jgi:two-component system, cell cycle sensor histidine kinase and response regulator CckA